MTTSAPQQASSLALHVSLEDRTDLSERFTTPRYLFEFDMSDERNKDQLGYLGSVASKVAGITYRQLDYWARKHIVVPSIDECSGSGTRRLYSFKDIVILSAFKKLLDAGVNLVNATIAISYLQQAHVGSLAHITIMSDGQEVIECTDSSQVLAFLQTGKAVFGVSLAQLWNHVDEALKHEEASQAHHYHERKLQHHAQSSAKPRLRVQRRRAA